MSGEIKSLKKFHKDNELYLSAPADMCHQTHHVCDC